MSQNCDKKCNFTLLSLGSKKWEDFFSLLSKHTICLHCYHECSKCYPCANTAVRWWRHCWAAYACWYGLASLTQCTVINIVYVVLAISVLQSRQNAYLQQLIFIWIIVFVVNTRFLLKVTWNISTKLYFIQVLMVTCRKWHVQNSKNRERWYYLPVAEPRQCQHAVQVSRLSRNSLTNWLHIFNHGDNDPHCLFWENWINNNGNGDKWDI